MQLMIQTQPTFTLLSVFLLLVTQTSSLVIPAHNPNFESDPAPQPATLHHGRYSPVFWPPLQGGDEKIKLSVRSGKPFRKLADPRRPKPQTEPAKSPIQPPTTFPNCKRAGSAGAKGCGSDRTSDGATTPAPAKAHDKSKTKEEKNKKHQPTEAERRKHEEQEREKCLDDLLKSPGLTGGGIIHKQLFPGRRGDVTAVWRAASLDATFGGRGTWDSETAEQARVEANIKRQAEGKRLYAQR
ncbi:hypothetical protein BJ508DRAFT_362804 [Ascobolus immersus RN42]|uniref:Uncharacterized protein n=1 Tax=Ascobolus immersus RN42 TaxID=1160509 RepID=A0A3N4I1W3_ASCIM|nr:hypothetical protein BJ508DRAFT_362804 [Ascobolus immersus RN42]